MLLCPHLPLPPGYRERLVNYVRGGGKLLVLDSADRVVVAPPIDPFATSPVAANPPPFETRSTAGDVLEPFGLSIDVTAPISGALDSHGKWPEVPISKAAVVSGGEPLAWVEGRPVAARSVFGKGSVTVVGFANRFSDTNMGVSGDVRSGRSLEERLQCAIRIDWRYDKRQTRGQPERETAMNATRRLLAMALLAGGILCSTSTNSASAAVYTWAGGDSGFWDTDSSNTVWFNGASLVAWSNLASPNDAAFPYIDQVAYVDAPVTIHNITFAADGNLIYSYTGDAVTLGGSAPTITVSTGVATIYAPTAGTSGLTKSGVGTLELAYPNTYSGTTTVSGGILQLLDPDALPGGTGTTGGTGNLVLNGGIVELGVADFTRGLGTGASQVQFGARRRV